MSVESIVKEAKSGLDNLIPPLPIVPETIRPCQPIMHFNVPESKIHIQYANYGWTIGDSLASVGLISGFIIIGYLVRIILG